VTAHVCAIEAGSKAAMFTTLDVDPSRLDEHERKFVSNIREHGWFGTAVFGDEEGGFSYTTGFWLKFNFPEIMTFALKRETAHDTFWHICRTLEQGERFAIGCNWCADATAYSRIATQRFCRRRSGTTRIISAGAAGSTAATISIACN